MCPGRRRAAKTIPNLPPTYPERQAQAAAAAKGAQKNATLDGFVSKHKFSLETLNGVMVIWLLQHALPWARMDDHPLRAAFRLANVSASLRSSVWAARAAITLFDDMQNNVVHMLKVSTLHTLITFASKSGVNFSWFLSEHSRALQFDPRRVDN